jgi:hypothetical protein
MVRLSKAPPSMYWQMESTSTVDPFVRVHESHLRVKRLQVDFAVNRISHTNTPR